MHRPSNRPPVMGPLRQCASGHPGERWCASRQALPHRRPDWDGRRIAPTALCCSLRGRAAELATLRQPRRVSLRSALRAPTPKLCCSPSHTGRRRGTTCRDVDARLFSATNTCAAAKLHPGRSRRASEAPRSAGLVAARASAHQQLTRRGCLSAANEVSVASSAAGHETEHRREVGAKRRPPQRSAAACPGAALPHQTSRLRN